MMLAPIIAEIVAHPFGLLPLTTLLLVAMWNVDDGPSTVTEVQ
jgi:hypothetical protein